MDYTIDQKSSGSESDYCTDDLTLGHITDNSKLVPSIERGKVLMVYPKMGFSGEFVKHTPLGLIYASSELVKNGIETEIFDTRLSPKTWETDLKDKLDTNILVVGISVMTGTPIKHAIEIGRFVKEIDPNINVVWGGPHATFYPETILEEQSCDYVVSGYGSIAFYRLVESLIENSDLEKIKINGVYHRNNGQITGVPPKNEFEVLNHLDIPYHLIEDYSKYGQLEEEKLIFSIYSIAGCPYKCTFCSSPAQYKNIGKRWLPFDVANVVDHIEFLVNEHDAGYIYFIDDDSFVNLKHVEEIIDELNQRQIKVKLAFRGARINEIKKMSDEFLEKLVEAGTQIMHVGAESGSNRILRFIKKNCTVDDILHCNRKLAKHPKLTVGYNFIFGVPTETLEEAKLTAELMLKLIEDNPACIIFTPNKFRPLPGTELGEFVAEKWVYDKPETLEDWINIEVEGEYESPWHPFKLTNYFNLILLASYFIDDKIFKMTSGNSAFYKILRFLCWLYKPIIRFRLKHNIYQFLLEYQLYRFIVNRSIS